MGTKKLASGAYTNMLEFKPVAIGKLASSWMRVGEPMGSEWSTLPLHSIRLNACHLLHRQRRR